MKILKQTGIIFIICWLSEIIAYYLPFPFPASVIGLVLLFLCLLTGLVKISHISEKSDFLLSNMAFFFIPAGVGMMNYLDVLKDSLLPIFIICILSTIITFAVTAYSVRLTMELMSRRNSHE